MSQIMLAANSWSVVCPDHTFHGPLDSLFEIGTDLRTVDYLFPSARIQPLQEHKTRIFTNYIRDPQNPSFYFIGSAMTMQIPGQAEIHACLQGNAHKRIDTNGTISLHGNLQFVGGGTGIFLSSDIKGTATFNLILNRAVLPALVNPEDLELGRPGLRLRHGQWSFLVDYLPQHCPRPCLVISSSAEDIEGMHQLAEKFGVHLESYW